MALRETLAELFPEPNDIRLLVIEAGIPPENVPLTGTPDVNWQVALNAAEFHGKWPRLLVGALRRFPEHTALWRALRERAEHIGALAPIDETSSETSSETKDEQMPPE